MNSPWYVLQKISVQALVIGVCAQAQAQTDYWVSARGQQRDPVTAICAGNQGMLFLGTGTSEGGGALYASTDGGRSWTLLPLEVSTSSIHSILNLGNGRLLVGTADGAGSTGVHFSSDMGLTWQSSSLTIPVYGFAGTDTDLVASTALGVYRSSDSGKTWTVTGFSRETFSVAANTNGVLICGTTGFTTYGILPGSGSGKAVLEAHSGMIYRSLDRGESWQETISSDGTVNEILFVSLNEAFAALGDRGVVHSVDTGQTWSSLNSGLPAGSVVQCLAVDDSGAMLAGTSSGLLFKMREGSAVWEALPFTAGPIAQALSVCPLGDQILVGTDNPVSFLMSSSNRGATWKAQEDVLASSWIYSIAVLSNGALVAGTQNGVFVTSDEGNSWASSGGEIGSHTVYSLAEGDKGTLWAAAGSNGLFFSVDKGAHWTTNSAAPLGCYFSRVAKNPAGSLFAIGSSVLFRSTDNGALWSTVLSKGGGFLFCSKLGTVFIRDSIGSLLRSFNDGSTWTSTSGMNPTNTVYDMAEDSAGILYAGTFEGVFMSGDSGATWHKILDGETQSLAINEVGYLFRGAYGTVTASEPSFTKNNGISWSDIGSGLGSHQGIARLAVGKNGRVFAGTVDGGMYRSAQISLPVVLAMFAGVAMPGSGVRINWTTVEEHELLGFVVERAVSTIGPYVDLPRSFTPASGSHGVEVHYSYADSTPPPGVTCYYRLRQIEIDSTMSFSGQVAVTTITGVRTDAIAAAFGLGQNYPNPFNPTTEVRYQLSAAGRAKLVVYDLLGREVVVLADGFQAEGSHTVQMNASQIASGIYVYRLTAGSLTQTRKMIVLK